MKKIVLALAGAASILSSTPVLAQSANDAMKYERYGDVAYQADRRIAYVGPRANYGYGNYPTYGAPVASGGDSSCYVFGLVCTTRGPRPHPGEQCFDPKGRMYYLDKDLRPQYAEGSGDPEKVGEVDITCATSTYHATAAPVTQVLPVAAPAAQPNVFDYWEGNYHITVTKFPDGTQQITREYRQR